MASSSIQQKSYININDINTNNYGSTIRVKVSRIWTAMNPYYNTVISRDMILIDEKKNQIHGRVMSREMTQKIEETLREGAIVEISKFGTSMVKKQWRVTEHNYQLYINKTSDIDITTDRTDNIPAHSFHFFDYTNNNNLRSKITNEYMTDVIGVVTDWNTVKKKKENAKIVEKREFTIENNQGSKLNIVLENEFAHQIRDEEIDESAKKPILIITGGLVKYNAQNNEFYINSFSTTRIYLNLEIPETASLLESAPENNLVITEAPQPSQKDLEDMIFEDRRTLKEINAERENTTTTKEVKVYTCVASIYKIYDHWEWYYQACPECRKKVEPNMYGSFRCTGCGKTTTTQNYICKLHAEIDDGNAITRVTLFGNHLKSLLEKPIEDILNKSKESGVANARNELQKLLNKKAMFQIKIDNYNFTNKRSSLTTSKILPIDPVMEEKYVTRKREREQDNNQDIAEQQPQQKKSC